MRNCLRNAELRGGCAAGTTSSVARRCPISSQQLECDWLAPWLLSTVHTYWLLYFLLFCETHDLVWEIISVSEKRIKNCIVKIIDNVFEKWQRWVIPFCRDSYARHRMVCRSRILFSNHSRWGLFNQFGEFSSLAKFVGGSQEVASPFGSAARYVRTCRIHSL